MSIALDTRTFGRLLEIVMPDRCLSPHEARTIVHIAQLAAWIDFDDDTVEGGLLGTVTRELCAAAGVPPSSITPLSPLPIDAEERLARIGQLAGWLVTTDARELAFTLAYLMIVADFELAPTEGELLEELRDALLIEKARAADLAAGVSELVTPGVQAELDADTAPLHL